MRKPHQPHGWPLRTRARHISQMIRLQPCAGVRRVSFVKAAAACLEILMSESANQPLDDAYDPPGASPPTATVGTKRALRSAPVMLVRGVRMPAYAETGASFVS